MTKIDDKRVPALRFKGFNDDWAQRKLKNLVSFSKGKGYTKNDLLSNGTPILLYGMLYTNYLERYSNFFTYAKANLKSVYSTKHEVVMPDSGETSVDIARASWVDKPGVILGGGLIILKPKDIIFPGFLAYSLTYGKNHKDIASKAQGKSVVHIHSKDLANLKFFFPKNIVTQRKICNLLEEVNTYISLQQRKTEQLKLLKKAMLQKGFTNKSAPTLRFKGFSKAWTEYPLGNLGKACSGYGFPNSEQGGNKGIPFYKVSDMNLAGNEDEMIYANNYVTDAQIDRNNWKPIVDVPAIFFAKVGAAVLLNRKRLCKRPFLLDNNTMAYSLNKNILSTQFTKSLFETINLPSFIQVGALPSYNTNDIESIKVKIPKIDEQEKIGILLKKIERLITRQQSKIKKLHSTKQFLLQNMFI